MNLLSPEAARIREALVDRRSPERRIVARAEYPDPESKSQLGDDVARGDLCFWPPNRTQSPADHISGGVSERRGLVPQPTGAILGSHGCMNFVSQAYLKALERWIKCFGEPHIFLI